MTATKPVGLPFSSQLLAALAQRAHGLGFIFRAQPANSIQVGELAAEGCCRDQSVLPLGGGVQVGDALFAIIGDHGVADLREDLATKTVGFGVEALQCKNLRAGGGLDDERIHLSAADGAQRFLRLVELRA